MLAEATQPLSPITAIESKPPMRTLPVSALNFNAIPPIQLVSFAKYIDRSMAADTRYSVFAHSDKSSLQSANRFFVARDRGQEAFPGPWR